MSICQDCKQEMRIAESCTIATIVVNGVSYPRNTEYYDYNKTCHDCGIVNRNGHFHHFGCDIERCPCCSGQLISCACKKSIIQSAGIAPMPAIHFSADSIRHHFSADPKMSSRLAKIPDDVLNDCACDYLLSTDSVWKQFHEWCKDIVDTAEINVLFPKSVN